MNNVTNARRWEVVKKFSVEVASTSDRLYANGLQQVQLRVTLEVEDSNGNSVEISREEIRRLNLIEYAGGRDILYAYPRTSASPANIGWDWSDYRDLKYKFYPADGNLPETDESDPESKNVLYRDFWVRSKARAPLRIAAKIVRDDGSVFTSTDMANGLVTLVPVAVPTYRPGEYTLKATNLSDRGLAFDYIPFVLRTRGVLMEFPYFAMTPASIAKHTRTAGAAVNVAFTGYTSTPGEGRITYSQSNSSLPGAILRDFLRPGRPVILVTSGQFNLSQSSVPLPNRVGRVNAIDMYGNPHNLTIHFTRTDDRDREVQLV